MNQELITVVGASIQCVGIWALTVLMLLVSRTLGLPYLRLWAKGWLWLACSLTALQVVFRVPVAGPWLQSLYHFGELAFLWYLWLGNLASSGRPGQPRISTRLIGIGILVSLAIPPLSGAFTNGFVIQAVLLSTGFAWIAFRFWSSFQNRGAGLGVWITQIALALLAIDFAFHALALGWLPRIGVNLPGGYAHFTSLYDLLLEMLLAFGCMVLAMQDASSQIQTLTRLIPVCGWCRKIRDDQGFWTEFEQWVQAQGQVTLTHGICAECKKRAFPDLPEDSATD